MRTLLYARNALNRNDMNTKRAEIAEKVLTRLEAIHACRADDRCWMDLEALFRAAGLSAPDRRVGDKFEMLKNCARFIDQGCESGGWRSYAELEKENQWLRDKVAELESPIN